MPRSRSVLSFALLALALLALVAPGARARPGPTAPRPLTRALPAPEPCPGCWEPKLRTSWQWQLQYRVDTTVDVRMFDIDGFDATKALVSTLHAKGSKVVCYVSAGSWENWRPDRDRFPKRVLGRSNGWPGEKWLDIRRIDLLGPIVRARLDMCARKGFDGVEFDNVDGYRNATGFPLTGAQQLRYNVFLANQAHRRGLSAFLKNDLDQVKALLPYFDAALNEQCHQYAECARLMPFVNAGKPVFGVEYTLGTSAFCPKANARNLNFLKKKWALGAWRVPCRGA
jgi:hypothetical protein